MVLSRFYGASAVDKHSTWLHKPTSRQNKMAGYICILTQKQHKVEDRQKTAWQKTSRPRHSTIPSAKTRRKTTFEAGSLGGSKTQKPSQIALTLQQNQAVGPEDRWAQEFLRVFFATLDLPSTNATGEGIKLFVKKQRIRRSTELSREVLGRSPPWQLL